MVCIDALNSNDTFGQIARCTFDVHAQDIIGALIVGGTLIMVHPDGILDLGYLASVFKTKQISYIQAVPSLLRTLFTFLIETAKYSYATYLRSVCTSGKWKHNMFH